MNVLDRPPVTPASSDDRVPVFVPYIGVDTLKHLTDALDVGWLGMGATTKDFEERIARYLGLQDRYVVATNTGTSAMHIALLAAGIGPGDEVITPSFNYVADHQAIRATGAEVVMCDIRDDDLGIDVASAESADHAAHEGDRAPALFGRALRDRPRVRPRETPRPPRHRGRVPRLRQHRRRRADRRIRRRAVLQLRPREDHHVDRRRLRRHAAPRGVRAPAAPAAARRRQRHDPALSEQARLGLRRGVRRLPLPPHQHHGERRRLTDQARRRIHREPARGVRAVLCRVRRLARRALAAPRLRRRVAVHLQLARAGRRSRRVHRASHRARRRRRHPLRTRAPAHVLCGRTPLADAGDGTRRRSGRDASAALADGGAVDRARDRRRRTVLLRDRHSRSGPPIRSGSRTGSARATAR